MKKKSSSNKKDSQSKALCAVCGADNIYKCQLCNAEVCANHYDITNNVCVECRQEAKFNAIT